MKKRPQQKGKEKEASKKERKKVLKYWSIGKGVFNKLK
jgi:hypothetical protein